uniref:Uncharacterized protein n=1 Tax=mine drainage metagenome TaxID=410659 RepID=E6Q9Z9_9ZZZZ
MPRNIRTTRYNSMVYKVRYLVHILMHQPRSRSCLRSRRDGNNCSFNYQPRRVTSVYLMIQRYAQHPFPYPLVWYGGECRVHAVAISLPRFRGRKNMRLLMHYGSLGSTPIASHRFQTS